MGNFGLLNMLIIYFLQKCISFEKKYIFFLILFRLKGKQPVLQLTTKDGAIFQNSDPISLAFAENSAIASTVLEWIMPPLAQRYMETCAQIKASQYSMSND